MARTEARRNPPAPSRGRGRCAAASSPQPRRRQPRRRSRLSPFDIHLACIASDTILPSRPAAAVHPRQPAAWSDGRRTV